MRITPEIVQACTQALDREANSQSDEDRQCQIEVQSSTDGTTSISIDGYIGSEALHRVREAVEAAGPDGQLEIEIMSGGGSAFAGVAIHNVLANHEGPVRTIGNAYVGSAATLVHQAGDQRELMRGTTYMIHDAHSLMLGNRHAMRKEADLLQKVDIAIADIYEHGGADRAAMTKAMDEETEYSANEAKKAKLVDKVLAPKKKRSQKAAKAEVQPVESGAADPRESEVDDTKDIDEIFSRHMEIVSGHHAQQSRL